MPRTRLAASRMSPARCELVSWILVEEPRQQRLGDRGQRTQRLEIARASAIADGREALDAMDALVGNQDVPELAAEAGPALDDMPVDDDAAAETGADDYRNRGRLFGLVEDGPVAPQRTSIPVVQVRHRTPEHCRQTGRKIETGPGRMHEVRGSFRAEHSDGTRRARRVEPHHHHVVQRDAGLPGGDGQPVGDLPQADIRAFDGPRGMLAEIFDQETPLEIDEGVVDGGASEVDAGDDLHGSPRPPRIRGRPDGTSASGGGQAGKRTRRPRYS